MEIQLKKGLLDVIVLASLIKEDSYGYKIIQDISGIIIISESTLYPILRRLELQGLLSTYNREFNGRLRKYYCLTNAGRQRIDSFTDEWWELKRVYDFVLLNTKK
jgi:PadR family transcriptional regulator PadR